METFTIECREKRRREGSWQEAICWAKQLEKKREQKKLKKLEKEKKTMEGKREEIRGRI